MNEMDPIADVATDKMNTEITSNSDAIIRKLLIEQDRPCLVKTKKMNKLKTFSISLDSSKVGQVLYEYELVSEEGEEPKSQKEPQTEKNVHENEGKRAKKCKKEFLAPSVRSLVGTHRLSLAEIVGTGKDGRILKGDVLEFLEKRKAKIPEKPKGEKPTSPLTQKTQKKAQRNSKDDFKETQREEKWENQEKTVKKMTVFEKGIQKSMTEANSIPQFFFHDEYDLTDLVRITQGEFIVLGLRCTAEEKRSPKQRKK